MNKLADVPIGRTLNTPLGTTKSLGDLINLITTSAITIAGIIVLFLFLYGGLKLITSAGSNDPKSAGQGKQAVTYAVIGFIIIFASYWIIRAIEIIMDVDFITNPASMFGYLGS